MATAMAGGIAMLCSCSPRPSPSTRTRGDCGERGGSIGTIVVESRRRCRVSMAGPEQRRRASAGPGPLVVMAARKASSSSSANGGRANKQREGKWIPSSPPPPAPNTPPATPTSVGVRDEDEGVEERAVSQPPAEGGEPSTAALVGEDGATELQNAEEERESSFRSADAQSASEIGKALNELRRRERVGDPASSTGFWRGVAEETRLIEWPAFPKVLGTTGVVVGMILGSSVVLLTVNAILAASSDYVFNDPAIRDFAKTYLNLAF